MEYILDSLIFIFYAYSSHIHSKPSDSSFAAVSARGPFTHVEDTTIEHHRKHAIRTIVKDYGRGRQDIINLDSIILHLPASLSTDDNCPRSSHTNDTLEMSQAPRDVYMRVIQPLRHKSGAKDSVYIRRPHQKASKTTDITAKNKTYSYNILETGKEIC
ncbi:uncharacterized protein G2W53_003757 [Senna tora]|uniref:Uncharacterized protein n=1 Tax=Senna tora TaxID=362788 RepID=A0A834XC24_9FABA|nr:uncharacterized protein G2W53_003757 [Senna tora]